VQPLSGFAEVQVASDSKHVLEFPKRWERIHRDRLRGKPAYANMTLLV
jgi:ribonuclease HI